MLDQTPRLLFISSPEFVRCLFKSGDYSGNMYTLAMNSALNSILLWRATCCTFFLVNTCSASSRQMVETCTVIPVISCTLLTSSERYRSGVAMIRLMTYSLWWLSSLRRLSSSCRLRVHLSSVFKVLENICRSNGYAQVLRYTSERQFQSYVLPYNSPPQIVSIRCSSPRFRRHSLLQFPWQI